MTFEMATPGLGGILNLFMFVVALYSMLSCRLGFGYDLMDWDFLGSSVPLFTVSFMVRLSSHLYYIGSIPD